MAKKKLLTTILGAIIVLIIAIIMTHFIKLLLETQLIISEDVHISSDITIDIHGNNLNDYEPVIFTIMNEGEDDLVIPEQSYIRFFLFDKFKWSEVNSKIFILSDTHATFPIKIKSGDSITFIATLNLNQTISSNEIALIVSLENSRSQIISATQNVLFLDKEKASKKNLSVLSNYDKLHKIAYEWKHDAYLAGVNIIFPIKDSFSGFVASYLFQSPTESYKQIRIIIDSDGIFQKQEDIMPSGIARREALDLSKMIIDGPQAVEIALFQDSTLTIPTEECTMLNLEVNESGSNSSFWQFLSGKCNQPQKEKFKINIENGDTIRASENH